MAYEVHLSQFEGPLDLLLHLIEQAKVDIKDIFISEITAQYLVLMGEVDELDMDTASEFLIMAATLVYIKSRSLLPRPPREDPEGEEDPEAILVRQLREYKAFKEAGAKLEALQSEMARAYTRLPFCRHRNTALKRQQARSCTKPFLQCLTVKLQSRPSLLRCIRSRGTYLRSEGS